MNHSEQHVADKVLRKALKARFARGTQKWLDAYRAIVTISGTREYQVGREEDRAGKTS